MKEKTREQFCMTSQDRIKTNGGEERGKLVIGTVQDQAEPQHLACHTRKETSDL